MLDSGVSAQNMARVLFAVGLVSLLVLVWGFPSLLTAQPMTVVLPLILVVVGAFMMGSKTET